MANTIEASFGLNINPLKSAANQAVGITKRMASDIGGHITGFITTPLAGIAAATAGFFTYRAFADGIKGVMESGGALRKLSIQTGMTAGSVAQLRGIFGQAGVESDSLVSSIGRMQHELFAASRLGGAAGATIQRLHLDIDKLLQEKPEEQFKAIATAIADIQNPTAKAAAAMAIFGRSGTELLPVFEEMGKVDFGNLSQKSALLAKDAEVFHKATLAFHRAKTNLNSVFLGLADSLAPAMLAVGTYLGKAKALEFGVWLGKGIKPVIELLAGFFQNPHAILDVFGNYLMGVGATFDNAFLAAVQDWGNLFATGIEGGQNMLPGLLQYLEGGLLSATGYLTKGFETSLTYLQSGLEYAFQSTVAKFSTAMNNVSAAIGAKLEFSIGQAIDRIASLPGLKQLIGVEGYSDDFGTIMARHMAAQGKPTQADSFGAILKRNQAAYSTSLGDAGMHLGDAMQTVGSQSLRKAFHTMKGKAAGVMREHLTPDVFGAGEYFSRAKSAINDTRESGRRAIGGEAKAPVAKENWVSRFNKGLLGLGTGGLSGASMATGMTAFGPHLIGPSLSGGSLPQLMNVHSSDMQHAFNASPLLSLGERRAFENSAVAGGAIRHGTVAQAHNVVRAGDAQRRKDAEREKARVKEGAEKTNELLEKIQSTLDSQLEEMR